MSDTYRKHTAPKEYRRRKNRAAKAKSLAPDPNKTKRDRRAWRKDLT